MRAAGRLKKVFPAWLGKKQICCVLAGLLLGCARRRTFLTGASPESAR